jgi:hypothetical protein
MSQSDAPTSAAIWSSLLSDFIRCYQRQLPAQLVDPVPASSVPSAGLVPSSLSPSCCALISARRADIGSSSDLHGVVNLINNQQDAATANLVRVSLAEVAQQIQQGKWWLIEQEQGQNGAEFAGRQKGKEIIGCIQFDLFSCEPDGEGRKTLESFETQFRMLNSDITELRPQYRSPDFSGIFKGIVRERFTETPHGAHSDWEWKSSSNDPANSNIEAWRLSFAESAGYHPDIFRRIDMSQHGQQSFRRILEFPQHDPDTTAALYPLGVYVGGLILAPKFRGHRIDPINGVPAYFVTRIFLTLLLGPELLALVDQPGLSAFLALSPQVLLSHYHACRKLLTGFSQQSVTVWIGTVQKSGNGGRDLDIFSQFLMGVTQLALNRTLLALQLISNLTLNRVYHLDPNHLVFRSPNPDIYCLYEPLEPLNTDDPDAVEQLKQRVKYRAACLPTLPVLFVSSMTVHNYFHPKPDDPSKRCNGLVVQANCQTSAQIAQTTGCSEFEAANMYLPMETDMRMPPGKKKEKEANGSTAPAVPMAAAQSTLSVRDRKHERFISKTLTEEAAKRASQARELFLSRIDFIRQSDDLFDLGDDVKSPKLRSKLAVATERDPAPARVLSPHLKATLEIFEKGASAGPVVEGRTRGTSAAI